MISMQRGEEPWTTISKWVVKNEGFPPQDSSFRTFSLQLLSLNDADRSKGYNYSTDCATRFEWYKSWSFEVHRIIKSKLNENSAKESFATVSITHSDSSKISNTCQPASQPLIPQLPRKSPIKMSDVIRPKRQTFDEWLLQGSKTISKPQIKPMMSCTIEPPKNLIFNKELYKFSKSPISTPQEQPIKEENKDSLSDEDPPARPITPIDDGEEIDLPLIPSNQLGLLMKPSAGTLKNSDVMRCLYILNLIL